MPLIPVKNGPMAEVDECDLAYLSKWKWQSHKRNQTLPKTEPSRGGQKNGKKLFNNMAQEIMGRRPGFVIDHEDGNPYNNKRNNLRWATHSQNSTNWKRKNKTGVRGVFENGTNRFTARIVVMKQRLTLGTYDNPEEANEAYSRAAKACHGEFATTEAAS